jgi:hypothetical protein
MKFCSKDWFCSFRPPPYFKAILRNICQEEKETFLFFSERKIPTDKSFWNVYQQRG